MSTKKIRAASAAGETYGEVVFEQIHEVMFLFRSQLQQNLREEAQGIAGMGVKVLGFFAHHPGATQTALVQHSGRDKGQVARLVKSLNERGLLERSADAGRRGGIVLTGEGKLLHRQLQKRRRQLADKCAATLTTQERLQLEKLLAQLKAALSN